MPPKERTRDLKEWEVARNVLSEFDNRIHDLRKYGFSFLTALLAAESLLIPGPLAQAAGKPGIPDSIKLSVMLVTLLLIIAVRLIERKYQLFQKSAAQRALILERNLNIELTEVISSRHRSEHVPLYEYSVYIAFVAGVFLLGSFILSPNYSAIEILLLFTIITGVVITHISFIDLRYERGKEDWTIDPIECEIGEAVRITLTNLDRRQIISLLPGDVAWEIRTQEGVTIHQEIAGTDISIGGDDSYTWLWDTSQVPSGIYRVVPRGWPRPLRRKIIVTKPVKS